jgi:CubicO group peptidase (beta-lactamase class C family)
VDTGGAVWSRAYGWADLHGRRPATPETVYHLFSGTKLFTATAILQLVERKVLSLEDPVSRFFPDVPPLEHVSILDLLSHRSGLADSLKSFLAVSFPPEPPARSADALSRYRIRSRRPPRQRVEYRNVNYALLGDVVTRASGAEYVDRVVESILRPLGMESGFSTTPAMRPHLATGYVGRADPMRLLLWWLFPGTRGRLYGRSVDGLVELSEFQLATPAIGGLLGTVVDFARFLRAQLCGGDGVLTPESTRLMQTMVGRGAAGIESREGMAIGWKVGRVDGRTFLNHEGGGAGFTTELRLYPDAGIGVALAMNGMRMPATMRTAHVICEAVFGSRERLLAGDGA